MKVLLGAIAVAVLSQTFLLLVQSQGIGDLDNKGLAALLEEALNRLKEQNKKDENSGAQTGVPAGSVMNTMATNITDVLKDLTQAIQNNTNMIQNPGAGAHGPHGTVECEMPFFPVKSECFYVNKYKRVSWSEARKFCKGLGSDLAEPNRVNTLRAMLLDKYPEDSSKFFWVGASENGVEGNWTWISSRRVQPADWGTGQPDGGNENCVVLSRDDYPPLHDSPCYTHTMFICERIVLSRL
ncbi:hypothetical protein SK128_000323 [Halocaridina rubra]|uniref:C-type lectin domain-containing protein n=1 Tax=Halocaridina rubra TaxID=373956 RepID=A0AAN8WVM5_HALRR